MDTNQTNNVPVVTEYRDGQEWVNSRDLHKALESGYQYSDWIKNRLEKYDFIEGEDYISVQKNLKREIGATRATDYLLTLDTAKELAMLENNEAGRKIRRYFIGVEKASRELAAKFQALGGTHQVMTYALMGRVYQLFANYREVDIKSIFHIMELSLAKSALTSQYVMAKDVARAVRGEADGKAMSETYIESKVTEIRQLIDDFGFVPNMVRLPNGNYKALPMGKEAADAQ
jgi:phage anti-repressor protein